ncbi:MAG TPA: trypsin-like peptidase domain-containing protein [Chthonomonadales bacterium]|nr:trypsin-like peptidase domain-containing protein [Chthonomonadales bacterium]
MAIRKAVGLSIVFLVGVAVGGAALRYADGRPGSDSEAKRRALAILDQAPAIATSGSDRIVRAVRRIEPAVVNIDTVGRSDALPGSASAPGTDDVKGKGSGVILSPDGYIVTNNHVVEGASLIKITLADQRWFYATMIGADPATDLAVVKIDAAHLPCATLADSDRLQVGEWSIAVGNPMGLGSTVTVGVISAVNRKNLEIDRDHVLDGVIQTDAAINRGNSGGALANIDGQLVGINTAILSVGPSGGNIGLGFAIPSNTMRAVARGLIAHGRLTAPAAPMPWVGIRFLPLSAGQAQALGLPSYRGVEVEQVYPDSPAEAAGLQEEDILLSVDGRPIDDEKDVRDDVVRHKPGDALSFHVLRPSRHKELNVTITLRARPPDLPGVPGP